MGRFARLTHGRKQGPSTAAIQTATRSPVVLRSQVASAVPSSLAAPCRAAQPTPTRTPYHEPHLPASRLVPLDVHGVLSLRDRVERECLEGELAARKFSYIVVGGGTAGLVLARRLSEDPENKVLVLEAGPWKDKCAEIDVPNMSGKLWHTAVDWAYHSAQQEGLHERRVLWPRGKLLGGSSNFNACMLTRAPALDYDAWARLGNPGWDWQSLLEYHRRSESFHLPTPALNLSPATAHDPTWTPSAHGHDGPVQASYSPYVSEQMQGLFEALREDGLKEIDPNGGAAAGVGYAPASIDPKTQTRSSAEAAYYTPIKDRDNLLVITCAQATRLVFSSKSAVGGPLMAKAVEFVDPHDPTHKLVARVADEVILCGGTFESPQLLELSGIGNAHHLQQVGVKPFVNLPGVGENLQDHPMVAMSFRLGRQHDSLDLLEPDHHYANEVIEEYHHQQGPLTQGAPIVAYLRPSSFLTRTELAHGNDLNRVTTDHYGELFEISARQLQVEQGLYEARGKLEIVAMNRFLGGTKYEPGRSYIGVIAALQHALSRGSVHITSSDPLKKPRIDPRFLSHPSDAFHLALGARHVHELMTDPHGRMAAFVDLDHHAPPLSGINMAGDVHEGGDEGWEDWVRGNAGTEHHPSSTCSMLPRSEGGVVDSSLRVYGTLNVRVADMSVVPLLPGTHTQSIAYMIGEKASEMILEDQVRRRVDSSLRDRGRMGETRSYGGEAEDAV
ncbi:uncharacterized protein RHOBADRAFT_49619 [Rhodotorula graminis WP1]|uniref:Glucose-methanol-choline oxidoreductase N-terminal domain-containing protein n=1 Tax=Rhodotorula graminis (strain WP1) TaxID=578459 RepID=A0A194S9Q1_RHOGW|nr:uncharacterized protein RHOBADRAFT_49619 [Rhodotorula graminis WP1]KPV76126.1 hypothetical protein RHOBADRAFT_49619 [Rhodotorula graminis WP1]